MFFLKGYSQLQDDNLINITPNGVLENVFDRYGKKYFLKDLLINLDKSNKNSSLLLSCSSTSYFNLYFEPGCGMEDTTNPDHNYRRAIVCKVFEDLSNFVNSPLTTSGKKINIWVRNINNVITSPNSPNGVLGLASGFYCLPSSSTAGGIADNEIWKTIHTGQDSYLGATPPLTPVGDATNQSGIFYHGMITFNFNTNNTPAINFLTNLSSTTIPTGYYDLYSAVLREVTNALGFTSLIKQNGTSVFGPDFKYFSRYDRFLKTNNLSQFLITSSACSPMYDYSFNSLLNTSILQPNPGSCIANTTDCTNAIKFVGTSTVPVYTPIVLTLELALAILKIPIFQPVTPLTLTMEMIITF